MITDGRLYGVMIAHPIMDGIYILQMVIAHPIMDGIYIIGDAKKCRFTLQSAQQTASASGEYKQDK